MPAAVAKITDIEHRGDEMTHRILVKLNQTFITPFDREDIHLLASSLDDVLDFIFSAADRLAQLQDRRSRRRPPRFWPASFFGRPKNSARPSRCSAKKHNVLEHCVEVNRLENEADKVSREAIGRLFDGETRPYHPDQAERAVGSPGRGQRQGRRRGQRAGNRHPEERLRPHRVQLTDPSRWSQRP